VQGSVPVIVHPESVSRRFVPRGFVPRRSESCRVRRELSPQRSPRVCGPWEFFDPEIFETLGRPKRERGPYRKVLSSNSFPVVGYKRLRAPGAASHSYGTMDIQRSPHLPFRSSIAGLWLYNRWSTSPCILRPRSSGVAATSYLGLPLQGTSDHGPWASSRHA